MEAETEIEICNACRDDMCFMCYIPKGDDFEECCCDGTHGKFSLNLGSSSGTGLKKLGRPFKKDEDMVDYISAGRKRAAELAPIPEDYVCEWSMLMYAGGGIDPIVGCSGNMATDRHHGYDKNTLENTVGINLHRICADCHNRYHELNDKYYGSRPVGNVPYLPLPEFGECHEHDRHTRAEPLQVIKSNIWWKKPVQGRAPYRHWESETVISKDISEGDNSTT